MQCTSPSMLVRLLALVLVAGALGACGSRIEGTYSGEGTGFLEEITLRSGGKVNVKFMGMTKQGTYEIDGDELTISVADDTQVLRIDDNGCLVGGGLLGMYCKDKDARQAKQKEEQREQRLAGAYEAGDSRDGIRLEFEDDGVVHMTVREGGANADSERGTYQVDGDRIRIAVAEGPGLELVRTGDTLEGNVGYVTLRFVKR